MRFKIRHGFMAILGCTLVVVSSACTDEHKNIPTNVSNAQYRFDPQTIQTAIANSQSDLFSLEWNWQSGESSPPGRGTRSAPLPDFQPQRWSEKDFRDVLRAFAVQVGKDFALETDPWEIGFYTDCQYATVGIQRMYFDFFLKRGPQNYLRWTGDIDLPSSRLTWYEETLSDVDIEKSPLPKKHIAAETALQLVEQAGGANLRTEVNNYCYIGGNILRSDLPTLDQIWQISYRQSAIILYEVHVTSDNRLIQVVTPRP